MSLKARDADDLVIDLTREPYFAYRTEPSSRFLLTLPDKLDLAPAPAERERDGDLGLAAALPIKRHTMRTRLRDFDPLMILGVSGVLTVGVLMLTVIAFRH